MLNIAGIDQLLVSAQISCVIRKPETAAGRPAAIASRLEGRDFRQGRRNGKRKLGRNQALAAIDGNHCIVLFFFERVRRKAAEFLPRKGDMKALFDLPFVYLYEDQFGLSPRRCVFDAFRGEFDGIAIL